MRNTKMVDLMTKKKSESPSREGAVASAGSMNRGNALGRGRDMMQGLSFEIKEVQADQEMRMGGTKRPR